MQGSGDDDCRDQEDDDCRDQEDDECKDQEDDDCRDQEDYIAGIITGFFCKWDVQPIHLPSFLTGPSPKIVLNLLFRMCMYVYRPVHILSYEVLLHIHLWAVPG